jgi:hypothetical protein
MQNDQSVDQLQKFGKAAACRFYRKAAARWRWKKEKQGIIKASKTLYMLYGENKQLAC